ncbi:penicillin acylase family protein [Methylocapsa aurea]|uniref:penicillin acylase family protein n=1 Tax=Methylocapsa aurea TaxID=663610 RepID=UPI00138E4FE2|nr:penicillin acylase family protein [Methylocapsa aurea]
MTRQASRYMGKVLRRAAVAALALVGCFAGFVVYAVRAPLPFEQGVLRLAGLRAEASVDFDSLGTPRINAGSRADAFHALGFATAGDRLFQMDLLRRGTAGRLAEIFGGPLLEEDRWNRVMGFGELAGVILAWLPAAQRELLDAYAAGVNQAMAAADMFPVEFTALGYRPEPWRPEDSILVMLAMHAMLSWSGDQERTASVMRRSLPPSAVAFLTPESDCYNELLAPRDPARCAPDAIPVADLATVLREGAQKEGDRGGGANPGIVSSAGSPRGSNAWVVGPTKTRDGRAILANDMHLQLAAPDIWYRAELRYPGANLSGLTLPGVPLLITGSNGAVAWGLTSVEGDFADLVVIEEDPENRDRYKSPKGPLSFETRLETIRVRGGADEALRVRTTIWGPVLQEPLLGRAAAARWTALDPAATDLALADMDGAATVNDAMALLHGAGGPPLNVLLADRSGNIAWTYMGRFPRRAGMDGMFAESWADGSKGWDGYIPADELPALVNPPSGFLVNANQRMLGAGYANVIGHDFSSGYRAWRIAERLSALQGIGEPDMLALQLDTATEFYRYYQQAALRALDGEPNAGPFSAAELRRYLEAWDGRAEVNSLGFALIVEFRERLIEAILTPLFRKCREIDPTFSYRWNGVDVPVQRMIDSGRTELLPDRGRYQDWPGFLRAILIRSAETVAARQNMKTFAGLTWGEVNKVDIAHPLTAAVPALARFLDMPVLALPGCGHCVRFADGKFGASERMVVAPGREDEGILHIPGGQSGQPGSTHYFDQQESWVEGLPTKFSDNKAGRRLMMTPGP